MAFQGIRDFRTETPGQLRADLQRQDRNIEAAFDAVERERVSVWKPVKVTAASYQASHGELVLTGYNRDSKILLPLSTPEAAGHAVRIVHVSAAFAVSAVAQSGQTVNGVAEASVGANIGFREYVDDGLGGFWGPAV